MLIRAFFVVAASLCIAPAASAQVPPDRPSPIRVGAGGHVFSRLPAEGLSAGGTLMLSIGAGRGAVALEAGITRRDGHNDWRAVAGPRRWLTNGAATRIYGHVLGGVFIRTGDTGFSAAAGLGIENRTARRVALRIQTDLIHDRHRGAGSLGARVSVWLASK